MQFFQKIITDEKEAQDGQFKKKSFSNKKQVLENFKDKYFSDVIFFGVDVISISF